VAKDEGGKYYAGLELNPDVFIASSVGLFLACTQGDVMRTKLSTTCEPPT
jgi:hypothetical protein